MLSILAEHISGTSGSYESLDEAAGSSGKGAAADQPELSGEAAAPPRGEKLRQVRADGASSSAVNAMGALLWAWLSRCMERTAVLCPQLLRDAVVAKADRIQLLAILTGKEAAAVEGLHLSEAVLGARVVEATLPLMAVFEAAGAKMPMTAPKDLTDVPGMFAVLSLGHLARHQSITLLSCLLSSIGSKSKEKLGGTVGSL